MNKKSSIKDQISVCTLSLGISILPLLQAISKDTHTYSTWDNLEIDKCATAWLIVRFVDSDARFHFYTKGSPISHGIPFDTPGSEIRRTFNRTAFEAVMGRHNISDPVIKKMADIIRDVEINIWDKKKYQISEDLNQRLNEIITSSDFPDDALLKSFELFDSLYKRIENYEGSTIK